MTPRPIDWQEVRRAVAAHRLARAGIGGLSVALFLVVWQIVGSLELIRSDLISYPTQILAALYGLYVSGEFRSNVFVSLGEFVEGFAFAVVAGIGIGLVFALSRRLRYLLEPIFIALYTAPMIAFVPILVVWFGVDTLSKSVMVFFSAVIPIVINTTTGVAEVHESSIRALRAFGANKWQIVLKGMLPGALPVIMAGVRLGVGRGIVVLIAGEMYVSIHGVGRLIQIYSSSGSAAQIFVLVAIVAGFGFFCITLLRSIERRLIPWRPGA
jgi:ABC-type nitrate/sulfonate/bicarbonate transport system permease component